MSHLALLGEEEALGQGVEAAAELHLAKHGL
jgi:hypothetical protein